MIMKITAALFICMSTVFTGYAQSDSISNSFSSTYKRTYPELHYSYDQAKQIHNYSDNWDFDQDGKTDQLFFVGTGGAHVYYYLRIILSSDGVVRNYKFLENDMPVLADYELLKPKGGNPLQYVQFSVSDFNGDGNKDIFLHIDHETQMAHIKQLIKAGINADAVLLTYQNGAFRIQNYY